MPTATINKTSVDGAKAGARDVILWDDRIPGFGLKVTPAGGKTYVYQYRIAAPGSAARTTPKRYTIGRHGPLTPDQARAQAKLLAAQVAQGIDPRQREAEERERIEAAKRAAQEQERLDNDLAFETIADRWLDHYEHEKGRRPASIRQARLVVENHLKPALTGKPFPHIDRDDLEPIIDAIPAAQRAMRRAVFVYASVLFGWAMRKRYAPGNPLLDMEKPDAPKPRDRVLADDELADLWQASDKVAAPFGPFFRLLVLTGQRRSEVAGIEWSELDRATATWTIPPERAKNGTAQLVPLAPAVVDQLDRLSQAAQKGEDDAVDARKWPKAGFVLTTTGRTPISGITKAKNALDAAIAERRDGEALAGWRIHDLRRTLATGLQRLGVRFEVTEAVLSHISGAKGGVAGIYQRHDWAEEKRSALEAWARHLAAIVAATNETNVIPMREAKRPARKR